MTKEEAQSLIAEANEINSHLNNISELVDLVADAELQRKLRRELGQAMGRTYLGIIKSAISQFPELDPDLENGDLERD